jgi:predicted aspartyl protease
LADFAAFTYRLPDNQRHSIIIDVEILVPVPIHGYPHDQRIALKAKALIDTGASRSAISSSFAQAAKLISYEKCTIRMAKGEYISSVYAIDIMFPHQILAKNIKAAEFSESRSFDLIIGMDILLMTDFALTNAGGVAVLSLRAPPADKHIDFTQGN